MKSTERRRHDVHVLFIDVSYDVRNAHCRINKIIKGNKKKVYSFSVNIITIFISCNGNIQISLVLRTLEKTDVFISLDDNIYDVHSKRVNILYLHGICRCALVVFIRWANRGLWASCLALNLLFMQLFPKILSGMADSIDPDQTSSEGTDWSGSVLFVMHFFFFFFFFFFGVFLLLFF